MRTIIRSAATVLVGTFLLSGCGKTTQSPPTTPPQAINAVDFRPAFATASPELKDLADQVMMNIQASLYTKAIEDLDKPAAHFALNDTQKKVVGNLTDQLKKKTAVTAEPAR